MKVFYINSHSGILSTGRIVSGLARSVMAEGGDARICYGRKQDTTDTSSISENVNSRFELYTHALLSRITDSQGKWSNKATEKIIEQIKSFKPDVIHLHNLHGYYLNHTTLARFLKEARIPIVWTLHDCWTMTGHCCYFDFVNCDKYLQDCGNCPGKMTYPISIFADNSAKNLIEKKRDFSDLPSTVLVTPSRWLADLAKGTYLSQYPIKVINNGIFRDKFYPRDTSDLIKKHGLQGKKIVLGVCNVWRDQKGLSDMTALADLLPDDYKIVMVGKKSELAAKAKPDILAISYTDGIDELAQWYSAAHVFVIPTYEDNFPTVNLEALSCGTPVISYKTGGSCECIEAGCGAVVHEKTPAALADAIINFNTTDEIRKKCRILSEKYDQSVMYEKYIELYKSILN